MNLQNASGEKGFMNCCKGVESIQNKALYWHHFRKVMATFGGWEKNQIKRRAEGGPVGYQPFMCDCMVCFGDHKI